MNAVQNVAIPAAVPQPQLVLRRGRKTVADGALFVLYVLMLCGAAIHLYRTPIYSMDSIQYMGNALLMEERDPVRIHQRVYDEVRRSVPRVEREGLLGHVEGTTPDYAESRRTRAANPYRYAEFLPLFAIRPLYNQTLWLVSKTGMGLVRSGIVISVGSYFLLGILVFVWVSKYIRPWFTLAVSILLLASPPLMALGRETTADALATLVAFASLYLIFEKRRLAAGMTLLLASIYFRTDFVVLAGPVILACWWERRLDLWKAAVLAAVAVTSVLCINHFAGDYGIKMLYHRAFIGPPIAPAEIMEQFSFQDYVSAFRAGITLVANSFFLPFLLLGTIGVIAGRGRELFTMGVAYTCLHFLILPSWEERYFGLFYLAMGICAATAVGAREPDTTLLKRVSE
jgi:hypothetical protein